MAQRLVLPCPVAAMVGPNLVLLLVLVLATGPWPLLLLSFLLVLTQTPIIGYEKSLQPKPFVSQSASQPGQAREDRKTAD